MLSGTTESSEFKTHDLAGKSNIEQNLTGNVDLDFTAENRFKIMFSATTECSQLKFAIWG